MGTFVYDNAANNFAASVFDWTTMPVNAALVDVTYLPKSTDQFLSAIPAAAIVRRDAALTQKGVTADGIAHGVVPKFNALAWPNPVVALVLYNKTGNDATSDLLYYSTDAVGMPFVPNGLNWEVQFNQIRRGFFKVNGGVQSNWVFPPVYFTSRLYPLLQQEQIKSSASLQTAGSWFISAWIEQIKSAIAATWPAGGTFGLALLSYTNWTVIPDQIKSAIAATWPAGGTLDLGLISYTNWPVIADQIKSAIAATWPSGGTFDLGLISYTNWQVVPDQIKSAISATWPNGTFT